jgi:glycosyltransferase involved in cell wall biosynthesis
MGTKPSVICHVADFRSRSPGSFIDALLFLALDCRERMNTETFCIFPEEARGKSWLKRFEDEAVLHGFLLHGRNTFRCMRTLLEKYQPLIFHSHFFSYDVSAVALKLLSYRLSKVIWHLHSPARLSLGQRAKDLLKVQVLSRLFVDRLIAVGEGVFDNSKARGFSTTKLVLIQNGIDVARFRPDREVRQHIRKSLGVSENQLVYLLLGWDPHRKGVDLFIKAANEVASTGNQPSLFVIIGERATRDFVTNLPESRRLGPALRINDPIEDFQSFLNAVDVVVSASRAEGLPFAVLESMAAEKLILASDIPGAREALGGSRGVWLFPSENWMILATYMKEAGSLSSTELRVLGRANSRHVAAHFSVQRWSESVRSVYATLLI